MIKEVLPYLSKKHILNLIIYKKQSKKYLELILKFIKKEVENINQVKKMEKEENIY